MRKFLRILVVLIFVVFPLRVHAGGIVSAVTTGVTNSAIIALLTSTEAMHIANQVVNIVEFATTAKSTYDSFIKLVDAEKRALKNIASVVDIRSVEDFMSWTNRTMYLAKQEEDIYKHMGVKVGNNTYKMHEIMQIPDAMRNSFRDPYEGDFTEEQVRDMWIKLGLTPGNYNYMKTWEERNDKIAKRILTYSDIFADEMEEAAERNENIMGKYQESDEEGIDINEITKEAHITAMNTEMAIREQTRLMIEMHEYQLSRDKMNERLPTPPRRSDFWGESPFGSITGGQGSNSYERW